VTTRALPDSGRYTQDNFQVMLEFVNGTIGNITYTANGDKSFPKEFLEVFGGGVAARLDDYRTLTLRSGATRINRTARLRQDKGHRGEWQAIAEYLKGNGTIPILFDEIVVSTRATLAAYRSLITGEPVIIEEN
jgi:polar amino acid transport system substrate-binding protein